jgi:hypothetical protein
LKNPDFSIILTIIKIPNRNPMVSQSTYKATSFGVYIWRNTRRKDPARAIKTLGEYSIIIKK